MQHNYPRARGIPSPGLAAGPCLFKDTMQLLAFAQNQFSLGNAAMLVNEAWCCTWWMISTATSISRR
jgi:UDP-N-acetyl-D-mannosaminuronic acid dehydrogenase